MRHALSLFVGLYGLWLALSGHYTPFLLAIGAACAAFAVAVAMRMDVVDHGGHPVHLGYRIPLYWAWLAIQILVSAVKVSRIVLSPACASTRCWRPCRRARRQTSAR